MTDTPDAPKTARRPVRRLVLATTTLTALAMLSAVALPHLPASVQRPAVAALSWMPGLHPVTPSEAARPAASAALATDLDGEPAVLYPATEAGWAAPSGRLSVLRAGYLALCLSALAAGLLLGVPWAVPEFRKPFFAGAVLGTALALGLSHALPHAPAGAAGWGLRGLAGTWGVSESRTPGEAGTHASAIRSPRGLIAAHSLDHLDRVVSGTVRVEGRGHFRSALLGLALGLGCALVVSGARRTRWSARIPLVSAGAGLVAWLSLPFLPNAVGATLGGLLARAPLTQLTPDGAVELAGLPLLAVSGGVVAVAPLLLVMLVLACVVLLGPVAVIAVGTTSAGTRARGWIESGKEKRAQRALEPDWLEAYEARRATADNGTALE